MDETRLLVVEGRKEERREEFVLVESERGGFVVRRFPNVVRRGMRIASLLLTPLQRPGYFHTSDPSGSFGGLHSRAGQCEGLRKWPGPSGEGIQTLAHSFLHFL